MESPKRKMQKKNDYQRHKLFRKIKRRRKAQAEAEQHIAEKQLRKKLKLPKFGNGKTREVYTSDIHFNNDDTAGGIDRYGNKFDYIELPETVVAARKIPTFKDIEKQIGRKITQDEIDKVISVDPQVPIEVSQPIEKGMYSPSITNELTNTIAGTAGDAVNYLANKAGLPNLAPNEQLVETRDGDALFDLPGYGQAAKLSLYGLGRYGNKLGLKKLQKLSRQKLLERGFDKSDIDINKLKQEYQLDSEYKQPSKYTAQLHMPNEDAGLYEYAIDTQLPNEFNPSYIARENSQIVNKDGSVNMRNLARARRQLRKAYPDANDPKKIFNTDFLTGSPTNLNQHIGSVVKTARDIPVPLGYTRQDLVQAALGHDIGKVIDARQGQHEQISADMLINAMKQNGIIGVQDIKPDVIQAIAEHGLGDQAMDLDPLTKALHVADVTRGANYDQAAIHAGYLFNYPREYPKWNFQRKPLRDELVQNINPVLKRYGYETINPNSTLQEAQQALNSTIDNHRSFVRGVTDTRYEPAQSYMLTDEPTSSKLANGGRRGISGYRDFYGIPKKRYDGLYLSTNASFLDLYGNGGINGKVGLVRIPQNEVSKNSESLSERLLAGDFDVYNSNQIYRGRSGNPQSSWTLFGEPYRLQTGRSLRQDMIEKDPNVPRIEGEYIRNKGQVLSQMKPSDVNIGAHYLTSYAYDQPLCSFVLACFRIQRIILVFSIDPHIKGVLNRSRKVSILIFPVTDLKLDRIIAGFRLFPHRHAEWNRHRLIRIHISHLPVIISVIDLERKLRDILRELHIDTYIVSGLITGISHIYIEIHDLGIVRGRGGLILAEGECYRLGVVLICLTGSCCLLCLDPRHDRLCVLGGHSVLALSAL